MSFLTPPPDFDECVDVTGMLNENSCAIQGIFYPSPSSTTRSHTKSSGSYSPHSPSCPNDQLYMSPEQQAHQQHQPLFAGHNSSLSFDGSIPASGQSSNMYNMEAPFAMYDQGSWSSYPQVPAQYPLHASHEEAPQFYGAYPSTDSSIPTMLPPTPQPVTPGFGGFGNPVRSGDSASYLSGLSQRTFTPEASTSASMSISSRSCSPNPSSNYGGSGQNMSRRGHGRSGSIASASSPLSHYGIPVRAPGTSANSAPQAWRCAYPNCTSRATFIRGCDLRKHYNRHSKHLFCRVAGCPQSEAAAMSAAQAQDPTCQDPTQLVLSGGFSSKKDRARHEAKHNPGIKCEWQGPDGEECGRLFSRMDNMKDHVRRIHNKGQSSPSTAMVSPADKARRMKKIR